MSRPSSSAIRCSTAAPRTRRRRPAEANGTASAGPAAGRRRDWSRARPRAGGYRDRGPRSTPASKTSFPTTAEPSRPRAAGRPAPGIPNGPASAPAAATTASTISKRSSPPKPRSPTGCASSSRSPIADPARRMIGQYLIDLVDEAGYLSGDLDDGGGKARHRRRGVEAVLAHSAKLRSARHLRAQSRRMPDAPAEGAQPLRSGDAGSDRAARSSGEARLRRAEERSAASATKTSPT